MRRRRETVRRAPPAGARPGPGRYLAALWSDIGEAAYRLGLADRQHLDARTGWTEVHEAAALLTFSRAIAEALSWTKEKETAALAKHVLEGVQRGRLSANRDGSGPRDRNQLDEKHLEELVKACLLKG